MKKIVYLILLIGLSVFAQNNPAPFKDGIQTKLIALDTLTTVQRDALTLKASKGYVIFNADTNVLNVHNGTSWGEITGGGGGGAVDSVNGQTGVVVLDADDISDAGTGKKFTTLSEKSNWNTAYSWGDHAGLYKPIGYVPAWAEISGKPTTISGYGITDFNSLGDARWSLLSHNHSGVYEPVFGKNTAFNKDFGTTSGTVAEGNDSRINNGQTAFGWGNWAANINQVSTSPPYLETVIPDTYLPSTTGNFILNGSFFTEDMITNINSSSGILVEGHTINYATFVSSNKIILNLTTSATDGFYDVTLNNGISKTFTDVLQVVNGTVYEPMETEWTINSGSVDVSEIGEIKMTGKDIVGSATWNRIIPNSIDFRLDFYDKMSPYESNPSIDSDNETMRFLDNTNGDILFTYTSTLNLPSTLAHSYYYGINTYKTATSAPTMFSRPDLITYKRISGIVSVYINNVLRYTYSETNANDWKVQFILRDIDYVGIKYIDLSDTSGTIPDPIIAKASNVSTDTSTFNGILNSDDNTVQKALDKIDDFSGGGASISDTAYGAGWNGQTTTAPSQNAVYDVISGIVASATGSEQSEKFTAVGGETTWTLSNTPIAGYKRSIFISGIKQEEGVDYSISGNTVTWLGINNPLAAGDRVSIEYNDLTAPSAINDTDDVPEGSTNLYADANATNQGNTFNGANQLVKLDGTGKLPAIDGSALTNLPSSGGGTVDVVSNVATNTILGRVTAGSGDSEELTPTQVRTMLNVADGATANVGDATLAGTQTFTGVKTFSVAPIFPNTFTIGANNFTRAGAHNLTLTTIGTTSLTLPTSGTVYSTGTTDVSVADGGTGRSTGTTAYSLVATGTTATGAQQTLANGATTTILVGGGASALPVWTTATGTGAPVRATSPTLTTPDLGTPSALVATNATGTASGLTVGNSNAIGGITVTGTPTVGQVPIATSGTTAVWGQEYLEYVSTIYQTGTGAPTATVIKNNTGATITYARTASGEYTATASSGVFTSGKTTIICQAGENATGVSIPLVTRSSSTVIRIAVTNGAAYADDTLRNNTFIIRVYP